MLSAMSANPVRKKQANLLSFFTKLQPKEKENKTEKAEVLVKASSPPPRKRGVRRISSDDDDDSDDDKGEEPTKKSRTGSADSDKNQASAKKTTSVTKPIRSRVIESDDDYQPSGEESGPEDGVATKVVKEVTAPKPPVSTPSTPSLASFAARTPTSSCKTPKTSFATPGPPSTGKKAPPSSADKKDVRYNWLENPRDKEKRIPGDPDFDPNTLFVPGSQWDKFTEFEKQYWTIKSDNWDTVVFFKKGKFYELYEKDADIGNKEFDLKLTDRVNMKMVGVPEKSFPTWASKFIALGYKVARVDEAESMLEKSMREKKNGKDSTTKKIIQRELKCILTAGTLSGDLVVDDMATYIMAVKENPLTGEYGVVFLDASTGEFNLVKFTDDDSRTLFETLVVQIRPKELVLEKGAVSDHTRSIIKNFLVDPIINWLQPSVQFWDAQATIDQLHFNKYFGAAADDSQNRDHWPPTLHEWADHSLAMSALGGLVSYLASLKLDQQLLSQRKFAEYDPLRHGTSLHIDGQTLQNLEIVQNSTTLGTDGTLLALVNHCKTAMGKRLFRKWLCHPLRHAADINDRYDAVEDLTKHHMLPDLDIAKLPDLERLLSRIHSGTCSLSDFLLVLKCFASVKEAIERMSEVAQEFQSTCLKRTVTVGHGQFPDLTEPLEFFRNAFDQNLAQEQGHVVPQAGVDAEYDAAKNVVDTLERKLEAHLRDVRASLRDHKISYKHVGNEKYQLEIGASTKVPSDFILKSQTKAVRRYWTATIAGTVLPLAEAQATYAQVQAQVYGRTLQRFTEWQALWQAAVQRIAELDCLMSLARASSVMGEPACRPELIESDTPVLELREMRHPCVVASTTASYIPNDTDLGGSAPSIMLLTGPNMGGKSTLLRQTCLAVVMAQVGCYVPAEQCRLTPVDRIFTRIGANDNIVAGQSTFMVELNETSNILRHASPHSLVILDELGRGTSTFDGYAIAYAVLRHLVDTVGCRTMFATHYHMLCEEFAASTAVALNHMSCVVDENRRDVTFLYKLARGICPKSYGMNVANMAGILASVVDRAEEKANEFEHHAPAVSSAAFVRVQQFRQMMQALSTKDVQALQTLVRKRSTAV